MTKIALNLSKRVLERFLEKKRFPESDDCLIKVENLGISPEQIELEHQHDLNAFYSDNDFMETLDNYLYRVANDRKVVTVALWKEFERVLEKSLPDKSAFHRMTSSEKEAYDGFLTEAINEIFGESKAKNQFTADLENYRKK